MHDKTYTRNGKITPKYKGYFVSFWKKENDVNIPYSIDEVEELVVKTIDGNINISKEYLLKNKILSSKNAKGKLGFRIKENDDILSSIKK